MVLDDYQKLRDELNYQTGHFSSIARVIRHPTFRKIVELGKEVVPIILDEIDHYHQTGEEEFFPGWWGFNAIAEIMNGWPEEKGEAGVLKSWVGVWVRWGETKGYLAKDRPKYKKQPPIEYKGWIVVGKLHGEQSVLMPKRKPEALWQETMGTGAWVSKKSAASCDDRDWWKKYAWIFGTKSEAEIALDILNEKIKNGECSKFNTPDKAWVEEL
jgi:hypothetical protein